MPTEYQVMLKELRKQLACPIDWDAVTDNSGFCTELQCFWRSVAKRYERDNECRHLDMMYWDINDPDCTYDPDIDPDVTDADDIESLKSDLANITGVISNDGWIAKAREEYLNLVRPLQQLKIATDKEYPKHFAPKQLDDDDIRRLSLSGVSYLFPRAVPFLKDIIWYSLDDFTWKDLVLNGKKYVYVRCLKPIGASKGRDTDILKIDVDLSTPQAHAYPFSEEDIPSDEYIDNSDIL